MKIILACENKKIEKYFNEINNNNLIIKKVQYREGIIEIIKRENNINYIFLYEKLPGEISIEELIKKIKIINKKIKIIIFLEKGNINKKNKLNKLEIKNIYLINKINKKIFLNIFSKINNEKIIKNNKFKKNKFKLLNIKKIKKINYTKQNNNKNYNKNKIKKYKNNLIGVYGEKNSGKTTIIYLIIIFLLEKNNKILLININNKNNYFKLINKKNNKIFFKFNKKYFKNIDYKEIKNNKNFKSINFYNFILKQYNKDTNFYSLDFFKKYINENEKKYDYILLDIGYIYNKKIKEEIINMLDKKIYVFSKNILGIREFLKYFKNKIQTRNNDKNSLHIIQNMYNFNSISNLIIQNILGKFCYIHKIFYDKKIINLEEKFLNNKNIKLKISVNKIIKKILS